MFFYTSVTVFPDSEGYVELAKLVSSLNLNGYHGLRSLGYPLIISFLNENLFWVVLFQFSLGTTAIILWYKTLLNFKFNLKSSFLITLFFIQFYKRFFYETCILVESLVLFMITVLFYLISIKILDKNGIFSLIGLSLFFAYLVLIKPFYAFLPFLFLFFLFVTKPKFRTILSRNLILIIFPLFAYYDNYSISIFKIKC